MNICAHRICRPSCYRPAPIGGLFVSYRYNVLSYQPCGQRAASNRFISDKLSDRIAPMTDSIATSCRPATIQIPITLQFSPTTVKYPAVFSLDSCPTPAH